MCFGLSFRTIRHKIFIVFPNFIYAQNHRGLHPNFGNKQQNFNKSFGYFVRNGYI